jgi:cell filamentation protein
MAVDPATYPGTNVYVNRLHIRDAQELASAEASFTCARTLEYRDSPSPTSFNLLHLAHIHRHLFQDLYEWAGERRSYDVKKGNSIFTPENDIERYADVVYTQLAEENYLQDARAEIYIERLAYYYDITNRLHPFPEGNGRTQRLFIEDLAALSGMVIDWDTLHQWEIVETAIRAIEGDRGPLYAMFERILSRI